MSDQQAISGRKKPENAVEAQLRPATDVAIVAVCAEINGGRCVLLSRRPRTAHLGGMWELPGGKIEQDEEPMDAARRELLEETGLDVGSLEPIGVFEHDYGDRRIRLHAFMGAVALGPNAAAPSPAVEHLWMPVRDLGSVELPPANQPITRVLMKTF